MIRTLIAAGAIGCPAAGTAQVSPAPAIPVVQAGAVAAAPAVEASVLPDHTPVQLMVLKEISGNSARPGDRFKLRVNEAVVVGPTTVIPIGAFATGEIVSAEKNGHAGSVGRIAARLVSVDVPGGTIPLTGTQGATGDSNTGGLAMGIASFGLLGLLSRGNDGRLKAGAVLTGYVDGTFAVDVTSHSVRKIDNPAAIPMIVQN